jgi:TRAP-type C4-dicarboxylate transport system substrate-binding protein
MDAACRHPHHAPARADAAPLTNPETCRMKFNPALSALMIGAAVLAPAGLLQAQPKPVELRYTSGAPPKGNPWAMQIERFAKDVDEESKGEIKIQPFLASQLGSEQDTVQQVARGRIDMGGFAAGASALVVPEVALLLMPFYFRSTAELDCVLDNHMTKPVTDAFAKKGVQFLGWTEVGSIDMYGKKPFMAPKDLNGAKAAIYANKTQQLFFSSQGASVNPLGLPEWIPAFQTGMADVVFTTVTYGLPSGLTKVAPVVSKVNAYDAPALTLMNKATWDKLAKPQQDALLRASLRNPSPKMREEVRGFESTLFGMLEKGGGQVVVASQEQRDAWRKAMEPVYPQIVKETGGDAAAFYATMEAGRKACAK